MSIIIIACGGKRVYAQSCLYMQMYRRSCLKSFKLLRVEMIKMCDYECKTNISIILLLPFIMKF